MMWVWMLVCACGNPRCHPLCRAVESTLRPLWVTAATAISCCRAVTGWVHPFYGVGVTIDTSQLRLLRQQHTHLGVCCECGCDTCALRARVQIVCL